MISSHRHTTSQRPLLSLWLCSRRSDVLFEPFHILHHHDDDMCTLRDETSPTSFFSISKLFEEFQKCEWVYNATSEFYRFSFCLVLECLPLRIPPVLSSTTTSSFAKSIEVRTLKFRLPSDFGESSSSVFSPIRSSLESEHNSIISGINRRCRSGKQCEQQSNKMCYSVCILKFMGRRDESSSFA